MDNAEPYDLVTVLSRLEDLKGMAREIGRHSIDDLHESLQEKAYIAPVAAILA
jgi:hypothetical protein